MPHLLSPRAGKREPSALVKLFVVFFILTAILGCGLADYEARMDEQEKRIKIFDQIQGKLGPPLALPSAREGDEDLPTVTLLNLFLRPPQSIQNSSTDQSPYGKILKLYDYPGELKDHVLLGALDPTFQEDSAGVLTEVKKSMEDFYRSVYQKRIDLDFPKLQVLKISTMASSAEGNERTYYTTSAEARIQEGNLLVNHVFLTMEQKCWTALVYIYPVSGPTAPRNIPDLITFSLKTFAGGGEALTQKKLYNLSQVKR